MQDRITIDPEIHFGKPCVAGTRIPVQSVLELIREGLGFEQITRDYYPDLQPVDIRACVQYAMDIVAAEVIHLAATPLPIHPWGSSPTRTSMRPRPTY